MARQREWVDVAFTPDGGEPLRFGEAEVSFPDYDKYKVEDIFVMIQSSAVPEVPIGTAGMFSGTRHDDEAIFHVAGAYVVFSRPGKLILDAISADGVTSPISFTAAGPYALLGTDSITFVSRLPGWYEGDYQADVTLDPEPPGLYLWPEGEDRPEVVLCRAKDDPKHYRIFKYMMDIGEGFEPTGKNYGGFYDQPRDPTPADRKRAAVREQNAGRWIAWTRGFGRPVGTGDTFQLALDEAKRAGYSDAVCEWVPPSSSAVMQARP